MINGIGATDNNSLLAAISNNISSVGIGSDSSHSGSREQRYDRVNFSEKVLNKEELEKHFKKVQEEQAGAKAEQEYLNMGKRAKNGSAQETKDTNSDANDKQKVSAKIEEEKPNKIGEDLTEEEKAEVQDLKKRDVEVKAHENAHIAAGGSLVQGGASYSKTRGPDGNMYATSGEVQIDTSEVDGDPQATIAKAQKIKAAALAPANPSAQDQKVAAQASQMMAEAQRERNIEKSEEMSGSSNTSKIEGVFGAANVFATEKTSSSEAISSSNSVNTSSSVSGISNVHGVSASENISGYTTSTGYINNYGISGNFETFGGEQESSSSFTHFRREADARQVSNAYQKMMGETRPAPYGTGLSLAV